MADDVKQLMLQVDASVELARRNMSALERDVGRFRGGVDSELKKIDQRFADLGKGALTLGGVLKGALAGAVVGQIVQTNKEFSSLRVSLETATGSAVKADRAFDKLKDFAATTPFALQEVVQAFVKLKNLGLDPSIEALTSYGNTAGAMGKTLNDFVEAIADAATGEFERLKEFGIRASKQGDEVRFTFQGVTTTVKANSAEIEGYLRGIGQVQFAGGMEKQAKTLGGALSNLSDSVAILTSEFGEGGFNEAVNEAARSLADGASGAQDFAREIGNVAGKLISAGADVARWLSSNPDAAGVLFGAGIGSRFGGLPGAAVGAVAGSAISNREALGEYGRALADGDFEKFLFMRPPEAQARAQGRKTISPEQNDLRAINSLGRGTAARDQLERSFYSKYGYMPGDEEIVVTGRAPASDKPAGADLDGKKDKKGKKAPEFKPDYSIDVPDSGDFAKTYTDRFKQDPLIAAMIEERDWGKEVTTLEDSVKKLDEAWEKEMITEAKASEVRLAAIDEANRRLDNFATNLTDGLGQAIIYGQSLGDALVNSIKAAAAELIASGLLDLLLGKKTTDGGRIGGILASVGTSLFGGGRSGGGQVKPGFFYEVNERGQEYFEPTVPGRIVPAWAAQGAGGVGGTAPLIGYIDARGSTDPMATEMAVRRAVGASADMLRRVARPALPSFRGA